MKYFCIDHFFDESDAKCRFKKLIEDYGFKKEEYLFNWDEIPGNDDERLIGFLKQNFDIDWVRTAKIEKTDDGRTIRVSTEKNSISLRLNEEKTKVNIEINDGRTNRFAAKTENGKLNIYLKDFLSYASKDEFWIALQKTNDTTTLIADLQVMPKGFYTVIEYEYAEPFFFEVQGILPNRFKLRFRKEEEEKHIGLFYKIRDFSNFTFLIQNFYERGSEAFDEIIRIDHEISDEYKWRIPRNFEDDFLSKLESFLDLCGRNYSKMKQNHYLVLTHIKNIKKVDLDIDLSPIQKIVNEMTFKLMNSKVIYERIRDMKDIALGKTELGLQKYVITIQQASKIIEIFIIYAYTFVVWKSVNEEGFKHASLLIKYFTPLFIALGVVLFVEFLKDFKVGLKLTPLLYLLCSIVLFAFGIYMMNR